MEEAGNKDAAKLHQCLIDPPANHVFGLIVTSKLY